MVGRGAAEQSRRPDAVAPTWPTGPAVPRDLHDVFVLETLGDPSVEEVCFHSRPQSASAARRLTRARLRLWGLPCLAEVCELLVSELVGNAVRHTGAQTFGLAMRRRNGWLRVEVRDPSRALPCLLPVGDLDTSGRGLMLVDRLSGRWGVDLLPRGKTTWFEVRVPSR